ncbi:MAG: SPFH domain-containing protein, partial [Kiritimatiellae bacterium]|nr:SPFH domain-containing protein [Kiritimatiellia bacterium]
NPREFSVNILEIGMNQVSLLGGLGSAVLTKSQMTSQNAPMQELEKNMLAEQRERRADYFSGIKTATKTKQTKPGTVSQSKLLAKQKESNVDASSSIGFLLSQFVSFPSRDGFEISLDMTVEFELLPSNIAWIYKNYGDLPAAVEKIIMPTILSVSRLKGSAYGARDFIIGEGREKFQKDLTENLAAALSDKKIIVYSALIRHVSVPMQILGPIQQASIAQEQDLTNKEKQNTAKKQAELNTQISLIEQRSQQVVQETEKLKAEINADQQKQVAETKAGTVKLVAQIEKETAGIRAQQTLCMGKARADAWQLVEGENAKGFQMKVGAFGDAQAYGLWQLANNLPDDLNIQIIHAGEGTFWTDLKGAQLGDLVPASLDQNAKTKKK